MPDPQLPGRLSSAERVAAGGRLCRPRGQATPIPCTTGRRARGGTMGSPTSIGVPRFELGTSPTRTERATRLRHTPSAPRVAVRPLDRSSAVEGSPPWQGGGRDRRVCERAARDRALPGVRASGAPGRRRARGDDDRVRRLVLARALRARGGSRRRARAGAPRALLAQRAARRGLAASRPARGALSRRRIARRLPPRARRPPNARQQRAARRSGRSDARRPLRGRGARVHDRRRPRRRPRRARRRRCRAGAACPTRE